MMGKRFLVILMMLGLTACATGYKSGGYKSKYYETVGTQAPVPKAIQIFYDQILADPAGNGQNLALIKQAFHEDYNTRPNPLNPVKGDGPYPAGIKKIMGLWAMMVPDISFERQRTLVHGDKVVILSKVSGTINKDLPAQIKTIPMFPGVPAESLKGKKFETITLDLMKLADDGRLVRSWHMEDWASAQAQLVGGPSPINFGLEPGYLDY